MRVKLIAKGLLLSLSVRSTASVFAGAAVTILLLAGCSGANVPEIPGVTAGQTTLEACTILKDGLTPLGTALSDAAGSLADDPETAAADMATAAAAYETEVAKITNEDVKPAADESADAVTAFSEAVSTVAADPEGADFAVVSDSATVVSEKVTALGEVCS
jgi:hypothetical protein